MVFKKLQHDLYCAPSALQTKTSSAHKSALPRLGAKNDEINLAISDEEMQKRLRAWQAPEPNVKGGVLAKYAKTVGSASEGAITDKF